MLLPLGTECIRATTRLQQRRLKSDEKLCPASGSSRQGIADIKIHQETKKYFLKINQCSHRSEEQPEGKRLNYLSRMKKSPHKWVHTSETLCSTSNLLCLGDTNIQHLSTVCVWREKTLSSSKLFKPFMLPDMLLKVGEEKQGNKVFPTRYAQAMDCDRGKRFIYLFIKC